MCPYQHWLVRGYPCVGWQFQSGLTGFGFPGSVHWPPWNCTLATACFSVFCFFFFFFFCHAVWSKNGIPIVHLVLCSCPISINNSQRTENSKLWAVTVDVKRAQRTCRWKDLVHEMKFSLLFSLPSSESQSSRGLKLACIYPISVWITSRMSVLSILHRWCGLSTLPPIVWEDSALIKRWQLMIIL